MGKTLCYNIKVYIMYSWVGSILLVHWLWVINENMWLIITIKCHEVWIFMPLSMKCDRQPILRRQFHLVWEQGKHCKYIPLSHDDSYQLGCKYEEGQSENPSKCCLFVKSSTLATKSTLFIYTQFLTGLSLSMTPLTLENKQNT